MAHFLAGMLTYSQRFKQFENISPENGLLKNYQYFYVFFEGRIITWDLEANFFHDI